MKLLITGIGIVSPAGIGKDNFYKSLTTGQTGLTDYEKSPATDKAGEVKDFKVKPFTKNLKQARSLTSASHFAIAASQLAARDASFSVDKTDPYRAGVLMGTGRQTVDKNTLAMQRAYERSLNEKGEFEHLKFAPKGVKEIPIKMLLHGAPNITTFVCNYELSLNGYSSTIVSGSNSFFDALLQTNLTLKRKMADMLFCGAADSTVGMQNIMGLVPAGAESAEDCNIVPGEGAVFFLMQTPENIREDCSIHAEILGCTGTIMRNEDDVEKNINTTLSQAGILPDDIDVIAGSHKAKTFYSKPVLQSIARCFRQKTEGIPACSPIPYVGYTRAASGAFDTALAISVLETGKVPPILQPIDGYNCEPLFYDENSCIEKNFKTALVLSIGLTGYVYSAVIGKPAKGSYCK